MMLQATCECGKPVRVNHELAGQQISCLRCGRLVQIPTLEEPLPAKEPTQEQMPAAVSVPSTAGGSESFRDYLYWLLIFAFFPLVLDLALPQDQVSFERRLEKTLSKASPEAKERARAIVERIQHRRGSLDELFTVLPGSKLEGALWPRTTTYHWACAGGAAVVFWLLIGSCFPGTRTGFIELLCVGIFTGTLGVALVLSLHSLPFIGHILWLCMASAHRSAGDLVVMIAAFTLGVGLVEELGKLLPVLWFFRKRGEITWRRACLWGLASGAGFGVAEGVVYAETFYNGVSGMEPYLVRFLSCVVLHAVWTGAAALAVFHHQDLLNQLLKPTLRKAGPAPRDRVAREKDGVLRAMNSSSLDLGFAWVLIALKVVAVVMVLHGLYDAALSNEQPLLALVAALASFGWLVYQVEAARQEEAPAPAS